MTDRPMTVSVAVPGDATPGLREPIVVSSEENPDALRIRDALLGEPRLGGAELEVRVHDDRAILSGTVSTQDQKETVLDIAGRFVGRDRVTDEIETGGQISFFCEA